MKTRTGWARFIAGTWCGLLCLMVFSFYGCSPNKANPIKEGLRSQTAHQFTPATGQFYVSNGQIIDPYGNAFIARGINIGDDSLARASTNNQGQPLTDLFPHINFLRLPSAPGTAPANYANFISQMSANHIVVEIENHPWPLVKPLTGQDLATESSWYASMADYYKNNPYVWFGTMNEPQGSYGGQDEADLSSQQLATYNAVRNAGNNTIVMCEAGIGGGNPGSVGSAGGLTASTYLSMHNIVWDLHFYAWIVPNSSTDSSVIYNSLVGSVGAAQGIAAAEATQSGDGMMPLIIGEYGNSTDGQVTDSNGDAVVQVVETQAYQAGYGSAAWQWNPSASGDVLVSNGLNAQGPYTLSAYGQTVSNFIASGPAPDSGNGMNPTPTPVPSTPTPAPNGGNSNLVTVGSNSSFTDSAGNTWSISASGSILENGGEVPGGGGSSAVALYNGQIYGQDSTSHAWFLWSGTQWQQSTVDPTQGTSVPATPTPSPNQNPGGVSNGSNATPVQAPLANATLGSWQEGSRNDMTYAYLLPSGYDPSISYPIILFLHQLQNDSQVPAQQDPWFNNVDFRQQYPAIVVAPRCTNSGNDRNWGGVDTNSQVCGDLAMDILKNDFLAKYPIQLNRVYVTGNSMGGIGSWDMIIRFHDTFAATLILAGATYDHDLETSAQLLKTTPIWAIHGSQDDEVPLDWDRNMFARQQQLGGPMKYTEIAQDGHDVWDDSYPNLMYWQWLFSQSMNGSSVTTPTPTPVPSTPTPVPSTPTPVPSTPTPVPSTPTPTPVPSTPTPVPSTPTPTPVPATPTPTNPGGGSQVVLTPSSGGSFLDNSGDTWSISASGSILENGGEVPGGGGSSAVTMSGGIIYGQDSRTLQWYTWNGYWTPSSVDPTQGGTNPGGNGQVILTTSSGGSFQDGDGNSWSLGTDGSIKENGQYVEGGGGTSTLTYVASTATVWGQDSSSGLWYYWTGSIWIGPTNTDPTVGNSGGTQPTNNSQVVLTPGSGGSFIDGDGNTWMLGTDSSIKENGQYAEGGGGTSALTFVSSTNTVWGQDASTQQWYYWTGSNWMGPINTDPTTGGTQPTPTPVQATPTPTPVQATPTPTPVQATPTPTPGATPTPVQATPTPGDFSGSPLIQGPLQGATPGTWQLVNYSANGIQTNYLVLLPYNYDPTKSYPLLVYLHENGYGSDGTGQFLLYEYESQGEGADIWFNNTYFRTNYPAIVVCPLLIEDQDSSGNTQNWGGWGGPNPQPSETNVITIVKKLITQYSVYTPKIYVTGDSLGGIGTWEFMIQYNSQTGQKADSRLFAAGWSESGGTLLYGNPDQSVVTALQNVPIFAVRGAQDDSTDPGWDPALYQADGGSNNFDGTKAPNAQYWFINDGNLAHDVWGVYRNLDPSFGDTSTAIRMYNWLFGQTSPVPITSK